MISPELLHKQLLAFELTIDGCDSSGNVSYNGKSKPLVNAVVTAFGKPLTSPECVALKKLATELQWNAYINVRNSPIAASREARYRTETDSIKLKMDEDFVVGTPEWMTARTEWINAKNAIREALPYPE